MTKLLSIFAVALAAMFFTRAHTAGSRADNRALDGTWELVSGQPLPKGARDIKIISGGHFMFAAYDTATGKPLYSAGGTYVLNGDSYTEHMDFATEPIAGLIGKDQSFTVKLDGGDTFTQTGTLSNGKLLSEVWKRID